MQGKYPIWDSRVRRYLSALRRQLKNADDAGLLGTNPHLWTLYPEFVESITGLRRRSRLAAFPFKDIDKFLWKFGRDPEDDAASITTAYHYPFHKGSFAQRRARRFPAPGGNFRQSGVM